MNPFWGLFMLTGVIYSIFIDAKFFMIYSLLVIAYAVFCVKYADPRENTLRKVIMMGTWGCK